MALCTLQSATTEHRTRWVKIENFDQERVFRFGQLWRYSAPKIFYPFWAYNAWKLRIGLFDHRATKWCFWPACYQNLDSVLLRCDHRSNCQNFDLERLRTFTPIFPKVTRQDFLPILGAPRPKIGKIWKLYTFGRISPGEKFGNLTDLVPWPKRPNRNFLPWGVQNG